MLLLYSTFLRRILDIYGHVQSRLGSKMMCFGVRWYVAAWETSEDGVQFQTEREYTYSDSDSKRACQIWRGSPPPKTVLIIGTNRRASHVCPHPFNKNLSKSQLHREDELPLITLTSPACLDLLLAFIAIGRDGRHTQPSNRKLPQSTDP
jgi:hypothetical protein